MRRCWSLALVQAIAILSFSLVRVSAEVTFSAGIEIRSPADFYDPLTPYGEWVDVRSYGRCWHPTAMTETGWRPYADGHWEWTDCGWYWVSDDPWAWACYHYGSWVFDPAYGWIWVPGTEWAPAWVVWRESPDYIGWAPCGPSGVVVAPSLFCFVGIHHFHDRLRPGSLVVNDTRVIERTRVISGIQHETRTFDGARQQVIVNGGPDVKVVQRASGSTFTPRPVREIARDEPLPQRIIQERAAPWRKERAKVVQEPRNRTLQEQPRTRPGESQPGDRTGREQPRTYQQPAQPTQPQTPQRPSVTEPGHTPPTGREQPRVYPEQPSKPVQPPVRPTPPEQPRERVAPEQPRERVAPERPPVQPTPPERTLPPTGREPRYEERRQAPAPTPEAPRIERERPAEKETPTRPVERPTQPDRGRDRERDRDRAMNA